MIHSNNKSFLHLLPSFIFILKDLSQAANNGLAANLLFCYTYIYILNNYINLINIIIIVVLIVAGVGGVGGGGGSCCRRCRRRRGPG